MSQTISNLSLGAKIKFGKFQVSNETPQSIVWTLVSTSMGNRSGYPSNSATLHSTYIIYSGSWHSTDGVISYTSSDVYQWLISDASYFSGYNGHGFLYYFSDREKNMLLSSTNAATAYLPRTSEIGNASTNSSYNIPGYWGYYTTNASRLANPTQQVINAFSVSSPYPYWASDVAASTRYPFVYSNTDDEISAGQFIQHGLLTPSIGAWYNEGIRPAIHLSLSTKVSDSTDSDGCYTVITNEVPTAPSYIDVPQTVTRGVPFTVSWGEATDSDGTISSYYLYRKYDNGSWSSSPVYSGANRSYTETEITSSTSASEVTYRVRARDNSSGYSSYTTSSAASIITNTSPVISGSDGSLGTKSAAFTQTYAVSDADFDEVTVVERIDGEQIRSYTATLGATNTFSVTGETWLKLLNGSHSMTITATDANSGTATRTYSFVKSVTSFTIQNATPFSSADMPTRIKLYITRSIPTGAIFTAYVCNNGYDATPTWEDVTDRIDSNEIYEFTNDTKTASNWGVSIKVEVSRNGAQGECYVSAIGGNFDSN